MKKTLFLAYKLEQIFLDWKSHRWALTISSALLCARSLAKLSQHMLHCMARSGETRDDEKMFFFSFWRAERASNTEERNSKRSNKLFEFGLCWKFESLTRRSLLLIIFTSPHRQLCGASVWAVQIFALGSLEPLSWLLEDLTLSLLWKEAVNRHKWPRRKRMANC